MDDSSINAKRHWQLASIRLTAFSAAGASDADAIFKDFFGSEPDSATTQKSAFLTELASTHQGVVQQVSVAGPKVDVVATAPFDAMSKQPLPILPNAQELRSLFQQKAQQLLDRVSNVQRLAVGEHLLIPSESRVDAYERLQSFLPSVALDPQKSSDFFYRINRSRQIKVGEHEITVNRLSQWGCIAFNVELASADVRKTANIGEAVSLITDINSAPTVPIASVLSKQQQGDLISILFDLSREIGEKGDVP
jgi:hypothetical protein